jgi:aldehyde:ferredoxin oxidoreductase
MLGGTVNRILFVDLSANKVTAESPGPALYRDFLGGYGFLLVHRRF